MLRRQLALLVTMLITSNSLAAPPPVCRRVLSEVGFERSCFASRDEVVATGLIGPSGRDGLLVVRRVAADNAPVQLRLEAQQPNGAGRLVAGRSLPLDRPGSQGSLLAVRAADLNGDQLIDAVIDWGTGGLGGGERTLDVYLGEPSGGFAPHSRLALGFLAGDTTAQVGDFDADGQLEIAELISTCPFPGCPNLIQLYRVDDTGLTPTFVSTQSVYGWFFATIDHDRDGIDDLVIADNGGFVQLALGSFGAGLQEPQVRPLQAVSSPLNYAVADRRLIVAEGEYVPAGFFSRVPATRLIHAIAPDMSSLWSFELSGAPAELAGALDLDGDGADDLLVADRLNFRFFFFAELIGRHVYWGGGDNAPTAGETFAYPGGPLASVLGGLNAARAIVSRDYCIVPQPTPRAQADGMTSSPLVAGEFDEPFTWVAAGDFNEDGLDDLVAETIFPGYAAIGLARGDGTFAFLPLDMAINYVTFPAVTDHDGDGHLDLSVQQGHRRVGWGVGDGTFEWDGEQEEIQNERRLLVDLNGDHRIDSIELQFDPPFETVSIHTALSAGRIFQESPPQATLSAARFNLAARAGDIDGDGNADLVFAAARLTGEPDADLFWMRSRGDGTLEPAVALRHEPLPLRAVRQFETVDLDADGRSDLVLELHDFAGSRQWLSFRNFPDGVMRRVGAVDDPRLQLGWQLADVNGDGRPDLLSGWAEAEFDPSYDAGVWLSDGLGGFTRLGTNRWGISPGVVGRFRRDAGLDVARLRLFPSELMNLELFHGTGHVAQQDQAAPEVELRLLPVFDSSVAPPRFEGRWQIVTLPLDDCDDRPAIERRVVALRAIGSDTRISYRSGRVPEIKLFESRDGAQQELLLSGPSEAALRELLATGRAAGGFTFEHWGRAVDLASTSAFGVERGAIDRALRLTQRFVFDGDRLIAAAQFHPTEPLQFAVTLHDHAGKRAVRRVSFPAARDEAWARQVESGSLPPGS